MFYDFLIGFFLMNAMPHLLFGQMRVRFLSLFGFGAKANLIYAMTNVSAALTLFYFRHGLANLEHFGVLVGGLAMLVIYAITGRFFVRLFRDPTDPTGSDVIDNVTG